MHRLKTGATPNQRRSSTGRQTPTAKSEAQAPARALVRCVRIPWGVTLLWVRLAPGPSAMRFPSRRGRPNRVRWPNGRRNQPCVLACEPAARSVHGSAYVVGSELNMLRRSKLTRVLTCVAAVSATGFWIYRKVLFFAEDLGEYPFSARWFVGWLILVLLAALTVLFAWLDRPYARGQCPTCGYNMTGNNRGSCPECGATR